MKRALIAALVTAGAVHPGLAQQTEQSASDMSLLVEVEDSDQRPVPRFNVPVSELRDMDVFGADGEEIGEIEDVLATGDGEIVAVTVEVGGFLGVNERNAVIYLDSIRLDGLRLTLDLSRDQIGALPEWSD